MSPLLHRPKNQWAPQQLCVCHTSTQYCPLHCTLFEDDGAKKHIYLSRIEILIEKEMQTSKMWVCIKRTILSIYKDIRIVLRLSCSRVTVKFLFFFLQIGPRLIFLGLSIFGLGFLSLLFTLVDRIFVGASPTTHYTIWASQTHQLGWSSFLFSRIFECHTSPVGRG